MKRTWFVAVTALAVCFVSGEAAPAQQVQNWRTPSEKNLFYLSRSEALHHSTDILWSAHMQWTYDTVKAAFYDPASLTPTLDCLLGNQQQIGAAIADYYGPAAGKRLADLLTIHIEDAVPVLEALQSGDEPGLDRAIDVWYGNAKQIADLLSSLNPTWWPRATTESMWEMHITQTVTYAGDLYGGNYAQSIVDYEQAKAHMMMMSTLLANGIIRQFPSRFSSSPVRQN